MNIYVAGDDPGSGDSGEGMVVLTILACERTPVAIRAVKRHFSHGSKAVLLKRNGTRAVQVSQSV